MHGVRRSLLHARPRPISIDAGFSANCPLLISLVGVAQLAERRSGLVRGTHIMRSFGAAYLFFDFLKSIPEIAPKFSTKRFTIPKKRVPIAHMDCDRQAELASVLHAIHFN